MFCQIAIDWSLKVSEFVTAASILVAVLTFFIKQHYDNRQELRLANREIYQRLEFESIQLFRYDTEANEVTRILWAENQPLPENGTVERIAFQNYVCQYLNLFEMSVRFRKEKVMPAEVFGSWVIWYYDLFSRPHFYNIWKEVKLNYTCDLRCIADKYFEIAFRHEDEQLKKKLFFAFVSQEVHDKDFINNMLSCGDEKHNKNNCVKCPSYSINNVRQEPVINPKITWCSDVEETRIAAQFFSNNVNKSYISHGEFFDGRAIDMNTWRSDLSEYMEEEFRNAISKGSSNNPEYKLALAWNESKIIGIAFILLHHEAKNPYVELSDMVVEKALQSHGIGSLLLDWIEDEMRKTGIGYLFLESGINNSKAVNFFRRKGYQAVSHVMMKQFQAISVQKSTF